MLPKNTVITMIHTEAGGYNELAYGDHQFEGSLVLICTLGRAFGTVLYKDGRRCAGAPRPTDPYQPRPRPWPTVVRIG